MLEESETKTLCLAWGKSQDRLKGIQDGAVFIRAQLSNLANLISENQATSITLHRQLSPGLRGELAPDPATIRQPAFVVTDATTSLKIRQLVM
jgi:hypothetical protein